MTTDRSSTDDFDATIDRWYDDGKHGPGVD